VPRSKCSTPQQQEPHQSVVVAATFRFNGFLRVGVATRACSAVRPLRVLGRRAILPVGAQHRCAPSQATLLVLRRSQSSSCGADSANLTSPMPAHQTGQIQGSSSIGRHAPQLLPRRFLRLPGHVRQMGIPWTSTISPALFPELVSVYRAAKLPRARLDDADRAWRKHMHAIAQTNARSPPHPPASPCTPPLE